MIATPPRRAKKSWITSPPAPTSGAGCDFRGGTLVRCLIHVAETGRDHDQRGRVHSGQVREP